MHGSVRRAAAHAVVWSLLLVLLQHKRRREHLLAYCSENLRMTSRFLDSVATSAAGQQSDSRSNTPRGRTRALHVSSRHR